MKAGYDINRHTHLFAAWAVSRAASVKGCRFSVEVGREALESAGFFSVINVAHDLPSPSKIDEVHRDWRRMVISQARTHKVKMTHGVAAKLLNVYLKCKFVTLSGHQDEKVAALHPPIDRLLLEAMHRNEFGEEKSFWRLAAPSGWSKLNSDQHQKIIDKIRNKLKGQPLWMIEEHWPGNQ